MGGHLSCMYVEASSVNPQNCSSGVLKVVLACEGRTCEFSEPLKVAELMLEFPNHFVTEYDINHDKIASGTSPPAAEPLYTKRVSPLPADHDAKLCHVYLLLPMHRLNTRLSADEIALVSALATAPSPSSTAPQCTTLSYAKTSKVTPLSARDYQEAELMTATSNVAIAKSYSVPILELLEEVASMEDTLLPHNASQQHLHILRSKSWTPKLETIIESYL